MTAPEPAPDPPVRADEGKKRKRREPGPKEPKEPKERKERIQYPRSCPHCGKSFPTSTRYHKHVYFHTAERKFKCDHPGCEKSYKREVDLQDHQAVHLAVKPFRCVASACCGKTFARKCDLMNHVKFAHNGLTCEACGLRFRKKSKLEKHWKLVHPNAVAGEKVAPGICPECGKEYANYRQLLRHIQAQHGKKDKKYKCNSCDETFSTFLEMVRHRKAKHPKTYACEKCGLVYKSSDQLKRHKNAAHDDVVVRCPHVGCDFTFMSRPAMKLHFRVVHQQMKDFKCRHCQKDFAYKNVLRRHIRNVHKLEPPPEDLEPSRSSGSDGLQ